MKPQYDLLDQHVYNPNDPYTQYGEPDDYVADDYNPLEDPYRL